MAEINVVNESTIRISITLEDATRMVQEAAQNIKHYASDIVTIYEKMPFFDYTSFCFYAYDSAKLFEWVLGTNPREYRSFSLDAPDSFFYALFGGVAALYEAAKESVKEQVVQA